LGEGWLIFLFISSFSFRERKGAKETFSVPLRFPAAQSFEIPACLKNVLSGGQGKARIDPQPTSRCGAWRAANNCGNYKL
jgi:hypothetical protein